MRVTWFETTHGPRVLPMDGPLAGSVLTLVPWLIVPGGSYDLELDNVTGAQLVWTPHPEVKAA